MNIRVNGVYRNMQTQSKDRTVRAIFNGTVLYSIPNGEHSWNRVYKTCSLRAFKRWAEVEVEIRENPGLQFLDNCRHLVAERGEVVSYDAPLKARTEQPYHTKMADCRYYIDDRIVIVLHTKDGRMNIGRLAVDDPSKPHLNCFNPVIYIDETGKSYRFHGEHIYLIPHVEALLTGVAA